MLEVHFSRKYAALMVLPSFLLPFVVQALWLPQLPFVAKAIAVVAGLGVLWAGIRGVQLLLRPPLMFSADIRGITTYVNPQKSDYSAEGALLPWPLVGELELKKVQVGGNVRRKRAYTWVIACKLNGPLPRELAERSELSGPGLGDDVFYVGVLEASMDRGEILRKLKQLRESAR